MLLYHRGPRPQAQLQSHHSKVARNKGYDSLWCFSISQWAVFLVYWPLPKTRWRSIKNRLAMLHLLGRFMQGRRWRALWIANLGLWICHWPGTGSMKPQFSVWPKIEWLCRQGSGISTTRNQEQQHAICVCIYLYTHTYIYIIYICMVIYIYNIYSYAYIYKCISMYMCFITWITFLHHSRAPRYWCCRWQLPNLPRQRFARLD